MVWVPDGRRRAVCTTALEVKVESHPATIRCRARIQSLRTSRVGKTTTVVPTSVQGGPLSAAFLIWSTPAPTRAMTVREPIGPALAREKGLRCASSTSQLTWPLTRGRTTTGALLPPRGRALRGAVLALGGDPTLSASDRVRTGRGRGASARRPPLRTNMGDPLRDPRWGLVKRLSMAFGLCASGKPRTPDTVARASGIGTASGMLLWLLRGWPA